MKPKHIKWFLACQAWYFLDALKFSKNLPFKQPPIDYKKCLNWYKKAKKWHDKLIVSQTKQLAPPPPPPPPDEPPR